MPDSERHRRIAVNETCFREINDRLATSLDALRHQPEHIAFVCECASTECRTQVRLTRGEYEQVRADPHTFAVANGHDVPDAEDVVARNERFSTIRKHADVERITEATDPRSR